jgi:pyruvate dehydrogenase E1 component
VIAGAYRLIDRSGEPEYQPGSNVVHIFSCGSVVPEAIEASRLLVEEGVFANVINVTGPGELYSRFQDSVRATLRGESGGSLFMDDIIAAEERGAPIVTVLDGHPHSLAWIGGALKTATFPLGVTRYGQSGNPAELYREYEIDSGSIMAACFGALGI